MKTIKAGVLGQVGDQAALRREGLKWKDFLDQGYVIAGSPKTVRERLREAMKSLNCGHLMILQQIGSMPPEQFAMIEIVPVGATVVVGVAFATAAGIAVRAAR